MKTTIADYRHFTVTRIGDRPFPTDLAEEQGCTLIDASGASVAVMALAPLDFVRWEAAGWRVCEVGSPEMRREQERRARREAGLSVQG